jgi:hypothetical protein
LTAVLRGALNPVRVVSRDAFLMKPGTCEENNPASVHPEVSTGVHRSAGRTSPIENSHGVSRNAFLKEPFSSYLNFLPRIWKILRPLVTELRNTPFSWHFKIFLLGPTSPRAPIFRDLLSKPSLQAKICTGKHYKNLRTSPDRQTSRVVPKLAANITAPWVSGLQ